MGLAVAKLQPANARCRGLKAGRDTFDKEPPMDALLRPFWSSARPIPTIPSQTWLPISAVMIHQICSLRMWHHLNFLRLIRVFGACRHWMMSQRRRLLAVVNSQLQGTVTAHYLWHYLTIHPAASTTGQICSWAVNKFFHGKQDFSSKNRDWRIWSLLWHTNSQTRRDSHLKSKSDTLRIALCVHNLYPNRATTIIHPKHPATFWFVHKEWMNQSRKWPIDQIQPKNAESLGISIPLIICFIITSSPARSPSPLSSWLLFTECVYYIEHRSLTYLPTDSSARVFAPQRGGNRRTEERKERRKLYCTDS